MNETDRVHLYRETIRILADFFDNKEFTPDGRMYLWKARVTKQEDLIVNVYPHDHPPPHFHVISKQRNIHALFSIPDIELIEVRSGKLSSSDRKKIEYLFKKCPPMMKLLEEKYEDMNM